MFLKGVQMKRLPWKYVAGLVDGEGCVAVGFRHKNGNIFLQIGLELTLTESCKFVLDMLQNSYGGNMYRREYESSNWKPTYSWRLYGKTPVRAVFQNLYNYCYIKREQMKLAIWCIDNIKHALSEEQAKAIKEEFKLQKSDPHRLSEKAVERILQML